MEIKLPLAINQLELLFHLIKERTSKNMSHNNLDLSRTRITTKWVTREVAEPNHSLAEDETTRSTHQKENLLINGYTESEKPTILFEKRLKEAQTALYNGEQILSFKIIGEILVDIDPKYSDKDAIEEVHKTHVLGMARCHRVETMYESGSLSMTDYLLEKAKLDIVIEKALEELTGILHTTNKNTSQIVEFEIPSDYEGDEQDLLSMIYEIADKLGIPREEVVPRNFDN